MDGATHIVDRGAWLDARRGLLEREKAFNRERDALAEARRALPWVRVDQPYRFTSERGEETLADLFDRRGQLAVYHFMFAPDWDEGCTSCSFWADNMNGTAIHLAHRDTALVLVSSAPFDKLATYRRRMGWNLRWVSCEDSDFNRDFGVSWPEDALESADYNFGKRPPAKEMPGISCFVRDADGAVCHSYSSYGRGVEEINGAYHFLDLTAKGRDESGLPYSMAWLRRHDSYE